MKFDVEGHKNILAKHKSTLEFTKEDFLTKKGDCIIGINANIDFKKDVPEFRKAIDTKAKKFRKIKITMKHGKHRDDVVALFNHNFSHSEAMVIRKSAFIDARTFAYKANKSAKELNRDIFKELQKKEEKGKLQVNICEVKIKNIIFDFDDTLEEWSDSQKEANKVLADIAKERFNVSKKDFVKAFKDAEYSYILKTKNPKKYSRALWLKDAFKTLDIKVSKKDIDYMTKKYWDKCNEMIKLEKHVIPMLEELSKKYKLFIFSDSDGNKEVKMVRIHKLGIEKYFKDIITSDDTKTNKPSKKAFQYLLDKHKLKAEECFSVGDHAQTDLYTPKKLGMTTVWAKEGGHWSKQSVDYNYIDFEIEDMKELPKILKKFE